MRKYNIFATFLKKINLSINNLLNKYLNKLKLNNLVNIVKSDKFFLILLTISILSLSYLSLPNIHNEVEIHQKFKEQLNDKLNLNFNLSKNFKYNFFPRPHFTFTDSTISYNQDEISKIKKIKIYISLKNLFSLNNFKVKDIILENANFKLSNQNHNFFINLLDQNFKTGNFIINDSKIFFRNRENEVLFINKIINLKYFYENTNQQNIIISKNEIFNLPYLVKLYDDKIQKKIFSKLDSKFLKLKIENQLDYSSDFKKGFVSLNINKKKSNIKYEFDKNKFIFNLFDNLDDLKFFYNGEINWSPFFSRLEGNSNKINSFLFLNNNSLVLQLIKTEILNNKNLNFNLDINVDQIKNFENFNNFFLKSKIEEGLIDIDNSKLSWKNNIDFTIIDSLIYVNEGELILDGKLDLDIKNSKKIYQFLLTPKNYRAEISKIELNFTYNFDQKIMNLNNIRVDNKVNENVGAMLNSLMFKSDKLQNKIYIKNILNKVIKSYAG